MNTTDPENLSDIGTADVNTQLDPYWATLADDTDFDGGVFEYVAQEAAE
jgi:hypothetical protein